MHLGGTGRSPSTTSPPTTTWDAQVAGAIPAAAAAFATVAHSRADHVGRTSRTRTRATRLQLAVAGL